MRDHMTIVDVPSPDARRTRPGPNLPPVETPARIEPAPPGRGAAIKVLVVHDRPVVREGVAALLACEPDLRVLAAVGTVAEGAAAVAHEPPHVIVGALRTTRQGALVPADVEAVRQVRATLPWAEILVLVPDRTLGTIRQVLYAGARGCVVERCAARELVDAVRGVAHGRLYVGSPPDAAPPAPQRRHDARGLRVADGDPQSAAPARDEERVDAAV
jgi:DNA-binding NarL/FixJ family response regulator